MTEEINHWEEVDGIFDNPQRQEILNERYHSRQMHRRKKLLGDAFLYAAFSVAFCAVGNLQWMVEWLAYPVAIVCSLWASFCFGRWFENGKCWGWF